uniref:Putative phosphatidylinositol-4-phosphate 5-kinase n=1 Tax=Trypanosoma congolense (strain IL3000) TaxID=1068625 RepID=G0UW68_TRYCI|nr:putative phosphatidylinositol-4-phosphate 5-kinase [Trypanosoma congolense IL3000]
MGSCQAVGGAAMSGKGLTGRQVAAALSATAAYQLRAHKEHMKNLECRGEGADKADDCDSITLSRLSPASYREERQLSVELRNGNNDLEIVNVYEYAPDAFRFLRQLDGVDEEVFASEWVLPEERLALELGEGRSMAWFLKSKSKHLMCKTIAKVEVDVLLDLLPQYTKYFSENPGTLLMRFSMLLRMEVKGEIGYVLCFGDVFAPCRTLNEKWDLKGRKPKPGKYKHFPKLIRQPFEPYPYLIDTPRDVVSTSALPGSKDCELEVIVEAADKNKLVTQKDKDLTRLFWLNREERGKLLDMLLQDYKFLCDSHLMDYSLLIGVAYNESKVSRSGKHIRSMRRTYMMGQEHEEFSMESRPELLMQNYRTSQDFANGVSSLYDQEIYYIGIIDMLTTYTFKKKVAKFFKSFLWKEETLSTLPPSDYYKRIVHYTKIIFPEPHRDVRPSIGQRQGSPPALPST